MPDLRTRNRSALNAPSAALTDFRPKTTHDTQNMTNDDTRQQNAVMADASTGDQIQLNRYIQSPLDVEARHLLPDGIALILRSSGGSQYRLRAVDDDDHRLLLEKQDDSASGSGVDTYWNPFLRVEAELTGD